MLSIKHLRRPIVKRKRWKVLLAATLIASTTIQTFAAGWQQNSNGTWSWMIDDNSKLSNAWQQDSDGKWYHLDQDGIMQTGWIVDAAGNRYFLNKNIGDPQGSMVSGWKMIDNVWYFFNTMHDGTFGRSLTGWQWIDGYCYCFAEDGKMYANTVTPDGYQVNENGSWVENGKAVYISGKGIITKVGPNQTGASRTSSGGSSGGGGGGGHGGGSHGGGSNVAVTYSYTVRCIDSESGAILGSYLLSGKKGTTLVLDYEFDGYEFLSGNRTPELSSDNQLFTLYYEKIKEKLPEVTELKYSIYYVDIDTNAVLKVVTGSEKKGENLKAERFVFDGYEALENNEWNFCLTENNFEKIIYYQKTAEQKEMYSYRIKYIAEDDETELGSFESIAQKDDVINIEYPEFKGYKIKEGQKVDFVLETDHQIIIIYYSKEAEIATPSEPDKKIYAYTIKCVDFDDEGLVLGTFQGKAEAGDEVTPDYDFLGYTVMEDYSFTIDNDGLEFVMYYVKDEEEPENVSYTIKCIDYDTGELLATLTGTAHIGDIIRPEHKIDGYTIRNESSFILMKNNQVVEVFYSADEEEKEQFEYRIRQVDIDTNTELGVVKLYGEAGETIALTGLEMEGYEILGDIPESVLVSAVNGRNEITIYYHVKTEYTPEVKDVKYTIEFVSASDPSVHIMGDITGTGKDKEQIPIYFTKRVNLSDGSVWEAIDDSPRVFKLDSTTVNTFTIKYLNMGSIEEEEEALYQYCIRYIAEDTNAVLGVNSGYATEGTKIDYRSGFTGQGYVYGFKNNENHMRISSEEGANDIDVILKRTSGTTPDKNPISNKFDGSEWNIFFVDNEGNHLLPSVSGFTLKDDLLYIDYPDEIDIGDGNIYRAEVQSPYIKVQEGTAYKQIFIRYTKGDTSDSKLEQWKKKAQEAKNKFYQTTPYEYVIVYRERNSWNDVGLYVGMNAENSFISIPAININGYQVPDSELGGFQLSESGMVEYTDYVKYSQGSSNQDKRVPYTIRFQDGDGNDLLKPYTGRVAAPADDSIIDLPVYYPNEFTDSDGHLWRANQKSPQTFKIDALSVNQNENIVYYNKVYDNPMTDMIIEKESEGLTIFREFIIHTDDAEEHEFYLIGKDYNPKDMIPGELQAVYGVYAYGNAPVDTFELDGTIYTVCKITYKRTFNEENCTHKWAVTDKIMGGCLVNGNETIACSKCGYSYSVILPAAGHVDKNHDTVCDNCGKRFYPNNIGDEVVVNFKSGALDIGNYQFKFVCVDDSYIGPDGEEMMLYLCEDNINSGVYGAYSEKGLADFNTSDLRDFLNEEFLDGLGNLRDDAMLNVDDNRVSILSREQYETYLKDAENRYEFPEGTFLTSTLSSDGSKVVLTNGMEVYPEDAVNYPVRPVIALKKPDTGDTVAKTTWHLGDIQARTIGNEVYLFRCISENYKDKSNTSKRLALFLCETVIPADIINNPVTEQYETLFFGDTNNYKFSTINEWLKENSSDALFSLSQINIGVDSSYRGQTTKYKFSQLNPNELIKDTFSKTQAMYSNLFVLSVEEAIQYKDYLWKFADSLIENPETQIKPYCTGYWLRTPETDTNDMIYSVNLHDGTIEPISVKATDGNSYSTIGIRPAFVMPQYE